MNLLNMFKWITLSLITIGAINWGLIGAFNFDLVSFLFGEMTYLTRAIYLMVGLSAIGYLIMKIFETPEDSCCCN